MQEELYYWDIIYTVAIAGQAKEDQTYYSFETKKERKGPCLYKTYLGYYKVKCKAPKRENISCDLNVEKLLIEQVDDDAKQYMSKELKEENNEKYRVRIFLATCTEELVEK